MERNSKVGRVAILQKMFVIFQSFTIVKPMPLFLTYAKLSVLNFFILLKNICEKVNFSKNLKDRHFLMGGPTNVIFGLF